MPTDPQSDAAGEIRARLANATGRTFWRSLEELADTPRLASALEAEFPYLVRLQPGIDRRTMLKFMAAPLALAGLSGCGADADESALPYVNAPEFAVPGQPIWYASAVTFCGYAQPVLGKTHVGRPVKLEGNPDHPASGGASDIFAQAALLGLYDPERSQAPRYLGRPASWDRLDAAMTERAAALDETGGEGFRLLTGNVTSPTLRRQMAALLNRWPKARWHVHETVNDDARLEATELVLGRRLDQHRHFEDAETVVSFDDDFLGPGPHQTVHAQRWAARRRAFQAGEGGSRLYSAEPTPTSTGAVADERLVVSPRRIGVLLSALGVALGVGDAANTPDQTEAAWVRGAAAGLAENRGRSLVTVGAHYPADLQALALAINEKIGNFGATLRFSEPVAQAPDGDGSLAALTRDMAAGAVSTLAVVGANPAYDTPAGLDFENAAGQIDFKLHAGLYHDETAAISHWHAPLQHDLETWSDARAADGTVSIIQPLVRPLYAGRSQHRLMENLVGDDGEERDIVQATWRAAWGEAFDARWQGALVAGFIAGTEAKTVGPKAVNRDLPIVDSDSGSDDSLMLAIRPDATVWDGRFADNAWLQETPKPLTKIVWGNVFLVAPQLAARFNLENGDEVRLDAEGRQIFGAVWQMPGQDPATIMAALGYGRLRRDGIADGLGYRADDIRGSAETWHIAGLTLTPTGAKQKIACTQTHQAMDGFDFVRTVEAGDLHEAGASSDHDLANFYPEREPDDPSWGMSIDLDLCIGCNACVTACVAENNVPVVGKDLVAQGREMHWLRLDRYFEGDPDNPKSHFQPVPCMHCEDAPCEMGCPVNATVHSSDGLNLQIYNRCIGTRTCASYCPYKVRRFNWFDFTSDDPEPLRAMRNPDVTVRSRGVMEKCTYCVQRISEARIDSKRGGRPIAEGEVVTACQQACPTQAIVFGNISDRSSKVSRRKAEPRDYALLEEVNTRPRTTYSARIANAPAKRGEGGSG